MAVLSVVLPVVIAVCYVILLWQYIRMEARHNFVRATTLKLTLGALFCITGIAGLLLLTLDGSVEIPDILVFCGLLCAVGGDYFLQFIRLDAKKFNAGIFFFALTQCFLLISMFMRFGIGWQEFVVTAAVLLLVLLLMKKQDWQLGKAQVPLTVYTVLLVLMAAKAAVSVFSPQAIAGRTLVMAAGAVLFLVSDLFLGIWNYHTDKRIHANLNWITYFSGMFLLALSLHPM
ncbi:lysoplasmalogenase family protein [Christensenella timonensis]|uniref:lysoplasmalogenase family protein n=1 Tax=Christensenella timonensis TaxID=1816678 RepID=UPI00082B0F0D|nr:lysoplasmalogenase family protein [Christensenella timonensis]